MQQTKEEKVHNVFETISNNYDKMNSVISFKQHIRWRSDTMKRMNVRENAKALDVCCGTADWTIALAQAVGPNGKVVGIDFSENMLKVGEDKVRHFKQIELVHGNAMDLPFPNDTFDYVTIGFGLRNVPDIDQVLRELHRVVKPGGMVVCLETSQPTLIGYKQLYFFYFRYIMPLFGKLLAKSYQEYAWLNESARNFPGMKELANKFNQAGLQNVKYKSYNGGVAAVHIGYKENNK